MSEPLSSSEIEDVLSSIRRLVSEDMRPMQGSSIRPAPASAPQPPADGKLILTPALRVVSSAEPRRPADPPMFVAVPRVDHHVDAAPIESVLASLGAGVDTQDDEWEAEVGDAAPTASLQPGFGADPEDGFDAGAYFDAAEDAAEDAGEYAGFVEMAEAEDFLPEAEVPAWAQQAEVEDLISRAEPVPAEPDADWAAEAEASVIAALEADAEAAVIEGVTESVQARFADAPDDYLDMEPQIDEELLRELVRDVLREELAGRIGERITRNIRKLVRAEIALALAAQELN